MSKHDYTEFDSALVEQIKFGCNRMALLETQSNLLKMAAPFCAGTDTPGWRVIDRRLQSLRKKGRILHNGKHWVAIDGGKQ